jgi:trans-2,3-dihydro-3-hydroxyanthranilate isomerase
VLGERCAAVSLICSRHDERCLAHEIKGWFIIIERPMSSTQELEYYVVDVFTREALKGNPLAVVMNTCGMTSERMQAIAREFNLSETTFVERGHLDAELSEGVRVRIFTTREELNFAGHPTLGTASVLRLHAPECVASGMVKLKLNVGTVPVVFSNGEGDALHGEMTQPDPVFGALLDRDVVARICGLSEEDLDPKLIPQVVSTGTAFAIVPLRSVEALGRLKVDHDAAAPWRAKTGARWFFCLAPNTAKNSSHAKRLWRARMQFYGGEDPATGSAAGCAISYLVEHGAVASDEPIVVHQGVEMGRPSEIHLAATKLDSGVTNVRVGGSTVPVANGRLFLP